MKNLLTTILLLLPSIAFTQNTDLERLFIERVNIVRDSLGLTPLFLIEEYREISNSHVNYILRTGNIAHKQIGTSTPYGSDRAKKYGGGELSSTSEIITYNTMNFNNDTLIVDTFIDCFLNSELHRIVLLGDTKGSCTLSIYHSNNKNICVVNFTRANTYDSKYSKYDWSCFDN